MDAPSGVADHGDSEGPRHDGFLFFGEGDQIVQFGTPDTFHDQVVEFLGLIDRVDFDDGGVMEGGSEAGFFEKHLAFLGIDADLGQEDLEDDIALLSVGELLCGGPNVCGGS